jgi:hypothetical protein
LEEISSAYLSVKKYFGKHVLVAIDGKVLGGTLDKLQNGRHLARPRAVSLQIVVSGGEYIWFGKG